MTTLKVNLGAKKYDILIEKGILKDAGSEIKKIYNGIKIAVITDKNVYSLYGNILNDALTSYGFNADFIIVDPGEKSKSVEVLENVYSNLVEFNITRGDMIITFGGGVVGDLGGFAASTYLRGIPYVQIPTSLLAQIDSSIGGKVAVNLKQGKNLVGSFYQPKKVLIYPDLLSTLPPKFIKDGLGEVIKYACIKSLDLYELLINIKSKEELFNNIDKIILTCCTIKKEIVEEDELDTDIRMLLNFGHTLGHAIENYYNYETYSHGEAVAMGMYYITLKSEILGYTELGTSDKIKEILHNFKIDYSFPIMGLDYINQSLCKDKKNISGNINLILLKKIGVAYINQIPIENIYNFLQ
jgi:3-dehydroquinate synthase